jgi:hypothetical protein
LRERGKCVVAEQVLQRTLGEEQSRRVSAPASPERDPATLAVRAGLSDLDAVDALELHRR